MYLRFVSTNDLTSFPNTAEIGPCDSLRVLLIGGLQ